MALTATLNDVNSNAKIVQTPGSGSGFLGGLASFGSALIGAAGAADARDESKKTRAAINDAAQAELDRFSVAQAELNPVGEPATVEQVLPVGVKESADKLVKTQQAAKQGSIPATAVSLRFESTIDELFRLHPERKAEIVQYYQSRGLDHYIFRDVKAAMAEQQNEITQRQQAENAMYDAGAKAGLFDPSTTSRHEGILLGQQWMQKKTQFDMAKEQINLAKTQAELDELTRKKTLEMGNRNVTQALIGDADIRVGQLVQATSALALEAGNDPSGLKWNEFKKTLPAIQQGIQTAKMAAVTQARLAGADDSTVKAVESYYDQQMEGMTRLYTGDLSRDKINQSILSGMQTQFGIAAAQAFPLWNQLAKLPGMANALPLLFGGDPAHQLSKEQQQAIQKELSGWSPASPDGLYHIQRAADILRGDLKLAQLNPESAAKIIGTVNTAVVGGAKAINDGDKTVATAKPFLTGLEQLSDAAFTLTPGVDPKSQLKAARMLGDQEAMNALVALAKDPQNAVEAVQVVVSARASAQKGIMVAKSGNWEVGTPGSMMKLVWDDKNQIVKQVLDEQAYKAYVTSVTALRSGHGTPGRSARQMDMDAQVAQVQSREQIMKRGDPLLAQRAQTINKYLDVMTRLSPVDPSVPAGLTPALVRKAAFLGEPLDQAAKAAGKVDPFEQRLKALEQQAVNVNMQTIQNAGDDRNRQRYEPIAHRFADRYGVPREVMSFLVGQESGWDAAVGQTRIDNDGDGKPDSSAVGIAQFTRGTAKEYGLIDDQGNDFRTDANKSLEAAAKYLSDLYKRHGDWEKALKAYGVIARSNFKSEDQYASVLNRARQAIQGE
jgi:hypothetical protein